MSSVRLYDSLMRWLHASTIDLSPESPERLSTQAVFPESESLKKRREEAAASRPVNSIRPLMSHK